MTDSLSHRGPDDEGQWLDAAAGVGLGHRRLAIIDVSPLGHQPMLSHSGRYVMVFNGEIYNFRELRAQLKQQTGELHLAGGSDTEVMLAAFECWGPEAAVKPLVGQFAFALWDRQERCLLLARDRMGEKPLYYGWAGDTFLFGSELKALRQHPAWRGELNRDALALYLRHSYIPTPYSIYLGIYKLPPATLLHLDGRGARAEPRLSSYWSLEAAAEAGWADPFSGETTEAVDELERLLKQSIQGQMIADVPLGAFLSGGIDSSTIVALMQAQSNQPVRTFSIGFEETGFDEAPHAAAVARHLGTNHTELYVTTRQAQEVIPRLASIWDEPFADSSQIPTLLVSELARRDVTVTLSGDGGDELFAGYPRYFDALDRQASYGDIPAAVRPWLRYVPWKAYSALARAVELTGVERSQNPVRRWQAASRFVADEPVETYRRRSMTHWQAPAGVVLGGSEPNTLLTDRAAWPHSHGLVERLSYLDMAFYLPEDILVKVDRASMAVSLESRVPLLDHRLVEFALRVPMSLKIRDGQGKWLLRQVLYRYVPPALVERSKMGFGVPIDTWLRTDLRDWAESLLDTRRLEHEGIFEPAPIRAAWEDHLSGRRSNHYALWDVLMFQQWQADSKSAPLAVPLEPNHL